MSESNIAVLVIGAALASGAILLGDPPPPTAVPVATVPAAAPPAVATSEPHRVADATIDCVTHPDTPGCGTQIVANVAPDPHSLSHPEGALHARADGCVAATDTSMHGDCSASGDAVPL